MRWTHPVTIPTVCLAGRAKGLARERTTFMELFFSPLACSMAARIALYETEAPVTFVEVDPVTKRTNDGADYREVHALGLVPALRTDDGAVLTENAAILQYVADRFPAAGLAPQDPAGRTSLHQWLSFIGTELHKTTFAPQFDRTASDAVKAYALSKAGPRLDLLDRHLRGRESLLDRFSVADAYLATVLTWTAATPIDLGKWPAVAAYFAHVRKRPSIARAFREERPLYVKELERTSTASP